MKQGSAGTGVVSVTQRGSVLRQAGSAAQTRSVTRRRAQVMEMVKAKEGQLRVQQSDAPCEGRKAGRQEGARVVW